MHMVASVYRVFSAEWNASAVELSHDCASGLGFMVPVSESCMMKLSGSVDPQGKLCRDHSMREITTWNQIRKRIFWRGIKKSIRKIALPSQNGDIQLLPGLKQRQGALQLSLHGNNMRRASRLDLDFIRLGLARQATRVCLRVQLDWVAVLVQCR